MSDPTGPQPLEEAGDEQALDAAIATRELLGQRIREELLQLRRCRNDTVPTIRRLPHEILAEIFTMLAHEARYRYHDHEDLSWIRITHVCARWRSIARSIPKMWSVIYPSLDRTRTDTFLALSHNSPLSIVSGPSTQSIIVECGFFELLTQVVHRIQDINLNLGRQSMLRLRPSWGRLAPRTVPLLETLNLTHDFCVEYDQLTDEEIPVSGGFWFLTNPETSMPKLRALHLIGFPQSLTSSLVRPSLTEIRVWTNKQFDLSMWRRLLANLPLLEILFVTGGEPAVNLPVPPPGPDIELGHLRQLVLRRDDFRSDKTGVCTQLLRSLTVPSSCDIRLSLAKNDPSLTMDVVISKKNGRCLGEPRAFTSLRVEPHCVQLWSEARVDCLSIAPPNSLLGTPCAAAVYGRPRPLLHAMQQATAFPLETIEVLCIQRSPVDAQLLAPYTHVRELHFHQSGHKDWLKSLTQLPPTALSHLRSLTLDSPNWRSGRHSEPLSVAIDAFLCARREAGVAIEALHLHRIRHLDPRKALPWFEHMASALSEFTWTQSVEENNQENP